MPRQYDRPLGPFEHAQHGPRLRFQGVGAGCGDGCRFKSPQAGDGNRRILHIERNIEPHRPTTPRRREMNRFFKMEPDVKRVHDRHGVFRDRFDHRYDIDFLRAHLAYAR